MVWQWLHYDSSQDVAFCYPCVTAIKSAKMKVTGNVKDSSLNLSMVAWNSVMHKNALFLETNMDSQCLVNFKEDNFFVPYTINSCIMSCAVVCIMSPCLDVPISTSCKHWK